MGEFTVQYHPLEMPEKASLPLLQVTTPPGSISAAV